MEKNEVIRKLGQDKLVAVIRAESKEQGLKVVDAVKKGGINFLEITLTVPGALEMINILTKRYQEEGVIIGAGTVLDAPTARMAILAGAQFVVSPCFDLQLIQMCNRYRVAVLPGAQTINEMVECLKSGADVIKVFPGDAYSPKIIKSFKGPLPQAHFMPTGGVSVENINEWLSAGAYAVGTGSSLTAGAKIGNYEAITLEARRLVQTVASNGK